MSNECRVENNIAFVARRFAQKKEGCLDFTDSPPNRLVIERSKNFIVFRIKS